MPWFGHDVMLGLLQALLHDEELSLVGAGIVHLTLAWCCSDEVRMAVEGEAERVGSFGHIVCPVATLLLATIAEVDDAHHALLLAVRVEVVAGDECLACIFRTADEVDDVVLFLKDARLASLGIDDALIVAEVIPVVSVDFYLDARCRRVLDHVALADAYQSVDVIPGIIEDGCVVGYRVELDARCRHAADDSELAIFAILRCLARDACIRIRSLAHACQQVAQRVVDVEERNDLAIDRAAEISEISENHILDAAAVVRLLQSAVGHVLVSDIDDALVVLGENDDFN